MKCVIKYRGTKETEIVSFCMLCKKPIGVDKSKKYTVIIKIAEKYPTFCDKCSGKDGRVR